MAAQVALPTALVVRSTASCGFCNTGSHDRCAIGSKQALSNKYPGGVVWACNCEQEGCTLGRRKCANCGNRNTLEVNPDTWVCFDTESCRDTVNTRRANDPFLQQLQEINKMAKIQEKDKAKTERAKAAPKVGNCACCGGETKGGKFLPGHDARFVKTLVGKAETAKFSAKSIQDQKKVLKDAGASEVLIGKFDKSVGLAKERVEKKAAADKEKAAAKAAK